jgi:cytidylate kinase
VTTDIIAIDGPAGSGKSTVARALAERLGWSVLDTGAMYRAVTVEALRRGIDLHDAAAVAAVADAARISTRPRVTINGRDVSHELRSDEVNRGVSVVAANALVRAAMVSRQRAVAAEEPGGLVVEGRDITTVVFPDARVKVFLTASLEERTRRRGDEGVESVSRRDHIDSSRTASPLRQADDALALDTTGLSVDHIVEEIVRCLKNTTSN